MFLLDELSIYRTYRFGLQRGPNLPLKAHSSFVYMSKNGDQSHCKNLDCVGQLEIGQDGNLLNHPRHVFSS